MTRARAAKREPKREPKAKDRAGRFDMVLTPEARAAAEAICTFYARQGIKLSAAGAVRLALLRLAESLPASPRASARASAPAEVRA